MKKLNINRLKAILPLFFIVVSMGSMTVKPVSAVTSNKNVLIDNFDEMGGPVDADGDGELDIRGYWWRTLEGLVDYQFTKIENQDCLSTHEACALIATEEERSFARMSIYPIAYPGVYTLSAIAEEKDGESYYEDHRWLPEVGKPVDLRARIRFSENYKADGTGGAVGSAGIWLWNSPIIEDPFEIKPQQAIGFNWSDINTFDGYYGGFKANIIDITFPPEYRLDLYEVDINEWFEMGFVWSVNESGVQNVKFYIDNQEVGSYDLPSPLPALTIEMWNDNQVAQLTGDGGFYVDFVSPTSDQHFDVDFIKVKQL